MQEFKGNMETIDCFDGEFDWLSNFFPCKVEFEGMLFQSSESAFQASKTLDMEERRKFTEFHAGKSKRKGKKLVLRSDWDQVKIGVMKDILKCKFSQNPELKQKLIDTGNAEIIEGNDWFDTFWGVCKGKGENHLGKLLMLIRKEI
tara:strand:- start:390 stop:827 length:438 start_codon:yes stop_codon:yes gene_type:complete